MSEPETTAEGWRMIFDIQEGARRRRDLDCPHPHCRRQGCCDCELREEYPDHGPTDPHENSGPWNQKTPPG